MTCEIFCQTVFFSENLIPKKIYWGLFGKKNDSEKNTSLRGDFNHKKKREKFSALRADKNTNGSAVLRTWVFSKIHINLEKNRMQNLSSGINRTSDRLSMKNTEKLWQKRNYFQNNKKSFFQDGLN